MWLFLQPFERGRLDCGYYVYHRYSNQLQNNICKSERRGGKWSSQNSNTLLQRLVPDWHGCSDSFWLTDFWIWFWWGKSCLRCLRILFSERLQLWKWICYNCQEKKAWLLHKLPVSHRWNSFAIGNTIKWNMEPFYHWK